MTTHAFQSAPTTAVPSSHAPRRIGLWHPRLNYDVGTFMYMQERWLGGLWTVARGV